MKNVVFALTLLLALAACDSAEQKAQKHLAAAQSYIEQGDIDRALVELRNALQKDEKMVDARLLFADLLAQKGRDKDAFGQYAYAAEQDPKNVKANRALALMAFDGQAWDQARKYVTAALALTPDDADLQSVAIGLDYRDAARSGDSDRIAAVVTRARDLLKAHPDVVRLHRVLMAEGLRAGDLPEALAQANAGLAVLPKDRDFNNAKLVTLNRMNDKAGIEAQIQKMVQLYPDDEELLKLLVEFYLHTGRTDEAQAQLQARIDPTSDNPQARLVYLRFLSQVRSPDVMRKELDRILALDPLPNDVAKNLVSFQMLKAGADFGAGDKDQAMAELEGLLKDRQPSADTDRIKIQLARMRQVSGNLVGAQALVEEVLAHDPGQIDGLKMKSNWLIDQDKTQDAIQILRGALSDAPDDPQALTLLARAYQREGKTDLMADMLARSVEASHQAPEESLRYATYLNQNQQYRSAETVLIDALRRKPNDLKMLTLLAQTHLAMKDWGRSQQDIGAIRQRFNNEQGQQAADELQARLLAAQGRADELGSFLEGLAKDFQGEVGARIAVIRNTVRAGRLSQALGEAQQLVTDHPDDAAAQLLLAQVHIAMGDNDAALKALQALVAAKPKTELAWLTLVTLQTQMKDLDGADDSIAKGLAALPDDRRLLISKAASDERKGDIDAAIAIYEKLYARSSDDLISANNLASLLASTRQDQASLDRAWILARRLHDTKFPAFQDTYGWIALRRGEEAQSVLPALQSAARGLPQDPSVAYHLAEAYAKAGQSDAARGEYNRGLKLLEAGAVGYPGLKEELEAALKALPAAGAAPNSAPATTTTGTP